MNDIHFEYGEEFTINKAYMIIDNTDYDVSAFDDMSSDDIAYLLRQLIDYPSVPDENGNYDDNQLFTRIETANILHKELAVNSEPLYDNEDITGNYNAAYIPGLVTYILANWAGGLIMYDCACAVNGTSTIARKYESDYKLVNIATDVCELFPGDVWGYAYMYDDSHVNDDSETAYNIMFLLLMVNRMKNVNLNAHAVFIANMRMSANANPYLLIHREMFMLVILEGCSNYLTADTMDYMRKSITVVDSPMKPVLESALEYAEQSR